jgi:hypothetical protein
MPNDSDTIPQELKKDTKHGHLELEGLLLAKEGISNIEYNISICKTFHAYLTFNKMPKLALANGLWIGVAPTILQKLTMVKETLITHYYYWMVLFKLRYTNKGGISCQHAFKGNV